MSEWFPSDLPWYVFNYTTDRRVEVSYILEQHFGTLIENLGDLPKERSHLILIAHGDKEGNLFSTETGAGKITRENLFKGLEHIQVWACVCSGGLHQASPPHDIKWVARTFAAENSQSFIEFINKIKNP